MKVTPHSRLQSRLNSVVFLLLLLSLVTGLAWLSQRYSSEFDWTRSGRHTLSEASIKILAELDAPLTITAFAREEPMLRTAIRNYLQRYQRVKPDIELTFVNPSTAPELVRERNISIDGELVLEYSGRRENVKTISEQSISNALQRLARGDERWIAFISGHGERDPLGEANHDLGEWTNFLTDNGFQIQPVNLNDLQTVPDNTQVMVLAGPRIDLFPGEVGLIADYLDNGGNLLWLLDPGKLHGLEPIADQLGLRLPDGVIIDHASQLLGVNDPTIVVAVEGMYGQHLINASFDYTTLFPFSRVIDITDATSAQDWQASRLIQTGDHTWLESDSPDNAAEFNMAAERQGPLPIAYAFSRTPAPDASEQRVVVVGDGDFLANAYINNGGNIELGNRFMNWLSEDDDLIAIPARHVPDARLDLSTAQALIIGFGFLIVLPLGLFASGMMIWWRRRKRQ
ncbi:MAG: GldG family protein [Gammaproteobacteria bacterium]